MLKFILYFSICANLYASTNSPILNLQNEFISIAEKSLPAVVVIERKEEVEKDGKKEIITSGHGSGFIVTKDGYILTNNHVIKNCYKLIVKLQNKEEYEAKIIGEDFKTDLAVLKIDIASCADGNSKKEFSILELADSSKVKVGQWAIAIGAPFSLDFSMTVGIVSQKGRMLDANTYEDFIQTDASINPGNSGGPLLDISGKVIGVNDLIYSKNGTNSGIGFAISSNLAKDILHQLIKYGEVIRPWMGVDCSDLNNAQKKKITEGVFIHKVYKDNPAEKAGIKKGDVFTKINNLPIINLKDFQKRFLKYRPNDKIKITLIRDEKELSFNITLIKQRKNEKKGDERIEIDENQPLFEYGILITEGKNKIVIKEIIKGSKADDVGIKPNMIILAIGRKVIKNREDIKNAIYKVRKKFSLIAENKKGKVFFNLIK